MKKTVNMVTVDIEDWYHICDIEDQIGRSQWDACESRIEKSTEKILTALQRRQVKATFFVLGYIAERSPGLVAKINAEGHEIASHGYGHLQVYKQSPESFLLDIQKSKTLLESITGRPVYGYRAPEWSIGRRKPVAALNMRIAALNILAKNGFKYDSSISPVRVIGSPYAPLTPYFIRTQSDPILEFPPLAMKTFMGNIPVGGGWGLRLMSFRDIKKTITSFNRKNQPALIYIHPWETDEDLPRVKLSPAKRFACYGLIQNTWSKFLRLLDEFEFTTVQESLCRDNRSLPYYEAAHL